MLILTNVYLTSQTVCVYLLWHFSTGGTILSQNGSIKIHLGELLKESGLSKQLIQKGCMDVLSKSRNPTFSAKWIYQ